MDENTTAHIVQPKYAANYTNNSLAALTKRQAEQLSKLQKFNIKIAPQVRKPAASKGRLLVVCSSNHIQFILYSFKRGKLPYVSTTDNVVEDPKNYDYNSNKQVKRTYAQIDFVNSQEFVKRFKGNEQLLEQYDCLLIDVFCNQLSDRVYTCAVLVEFSVSGRGLVVCCATNCSKHATYALLHSFEALEFHPLLYAPEYISSSVPDPLTLGTIHDPLHPLMHRVAKDSFESSTSPEYTKCNGVHSKATRVADWSCGEVLVACKVNPAGTGMVVALNFGAACKETYWNATLDGGHLILCNAITYASEFNAKNKRAQRERMFDIQRRTQLCDIVINFSQ